MESLKKIFSVLPQKEYGYCVLLLFLMLGGALLEAVGIGAILPLISAMGNETFLSEHDFLSQLLVRLGVYGYSSFVLLCTVGLIIFYFLKNLFLTFSIRMQIRFVIRNQIYLSRQLLAEYLSKPYEFHVLHNTASLLRNVNDGAAVIFSNIILSLLGFMTECITAVAIWVMLMMVDCFTALIVAGILAGLVLLIVKTFRKRIAQQGDVANNYHAQYLMWVNQSLGAIKETKIMHTEAYFLEKFDRAYRNYGDARGAFDFLNQLPRLLIEAVVVIGLLLLIVLKVSMGTPSAHIVPLLGLLALAAFRLMPSANRIVGYYNSIKFQMPFFHELYPDLQAIKNRNKQDICGITVTESKQLPFTSEINIDRLAFSYDGKQETLKRVTFRIAKGDFVGIVGASGAGKTTFVDLLLGLLTPCEGRITVDGVDILSDVRGWQDNLAYVPQEIYLIDASIRENIVFGQEPNNNDNAWLEEVLHMSELYAYVQSLPDGLETVVGERGVRLSGGQRQRIGIARALYRKPQVLILDEATSALDNETEKSITDTILKLKGKMTIISVAHRVSTLEQCDYKVKFNDGYCEIVR